MKNKSLTIELELNTARRHFYWIILTLTAVAVTILSTVLINQSEPLEQPIPVAALPTLHGDAAIEHLKQNKIFDSLSAAVTAARYQIETVETGAAANNQANGWRMNFTADGLQLKSTAKNNGWVSNWRLSSFGYGAKQTAAMKGRLRSEGNRVELVRDEQNLIEWFINQPDGVEHGFTVAARPEAANKGEALRLVMTVDGDLTARAVENGQALTLFEKGGAKALRYEKLKVWDAHGVEMAARMHTTGGEVWLEVEESSAIYPLTVDPTFVQEQKLTASDGAANDDFGIDVAISGNTAIVGVNSDLGAAYVFVRSSATWTQQQKLTASDGAAGDVFGKRVAISGDTAIIGASQDDIGGNSNQGSAYIFARNGTTWTEQQKLTAADGAANDTFGESVAISGGTVIVGARADTIGTNNGQGSAYIFIRSGTTWTQQQKLTASDGAAADVFGERVAISGDTAIIGAEGDDIGANDAQGSAYVFVRSGTTWTQQQKLTASDAAVHDRFGESVAISGDTAIVGASQIGVSVPDRQGAAYVFVRSGATWTQQQKLTASDAAVSDRFGISVAISGETVIVGAEGDDTGTNISHGSAYVFVRSGTTWTQQQKLTASDGATSDDFGISVAISCETAIVGAEGDDIGANSAQGSAYIFTSTSGTPTPCAPTARRTLFDFDGDGKADVSVFRPSNGAWYLQQSTNGFTGMSFGQSGDRLAPADYDGDGKTDIAVVRGGTWYIQRSLLGFTGIAFGEANDIPQPADYDGDGKADVAVFRPSNGTWYLQRSAQGFTGIAFGANGDKPVVGDYDGDGRADVAVNRTGVWYIQRSTLGFTGVQFGDGADKPVPSDYDGDSKTDVAVFRPSNGAWYLQRSQLGFAGITFGISTDLPVPADYDGDGKSDIAVFREGTWYLNRSSQGFTGVSFGAATDKPAPNAFIP